MASEEETDLISNWEKEIKDNDRKSRRHPERAGWYEQKNCAIRRAIQLCRCFMNAFRGEDSWSG